MPPPTHSRHALVSLSPQRLFFGHNLCVRPVLLFARVFGVSFLLRVSFGRVVVRCCCGRDERGRQRLALVFTHTLAALDRHVRCTARRA